MSKTTSSFSFFTQLSPYQKAGVALSLLAIAVAGIAAKKYNS